ncbi:MAG: MYG1 family protein [Proteobacteria bacterium]|nr:MYG1 family protein [Pseudomonadota bacterium]MCP4921538.1 MYG1 family protein [Pseudomonadota bacterium]
MSLSVATHFGTFHADDVLAWSMVTTFVDADATLVRTRDPDLLAAADIVFDVGGVFDVATRRFDHHQQAYGGLLSSAGMVLDWLEAEGRVSPSLAGVLRANVVDYVDAVDNGRRELVPGVPCFAVLVDTHNKGCETLADFDGAFHRAAEMGRRMLAGMVEEHAARQRNRAAMQAAMTDAEQRGSNVVLLDHWFDWKPPYYDLDGVNHPTQFVIQPDLSGLTWRAVAIPPERGSFDKKQPLPIAWAGLVDDELSAACGVPGGKFCHKNQFIMVFDTRAGALAALRATGFVRGALS